MERLIYGMKTIAFSQIEFEKGKSHAYIRAVDMQGSGTGQEDFYAPCTLKVTAKTKSAHTVFFVSCNNAGEETEVLCADGVKRVVSLALTHIDDFDWIKVGQIFKSGEKCYREGTFANGKKGSVGNHVHIEVAKGNVSFKESYKKDGNVYLRFPNSVSLDPTEVFFGLLEWNNVREDKLYSANKDRKVDIRWTDARTDEDMTIMMRAVREVVVLRETLSFNSSNKPNGKILAKMAKGEAAKVISPLPIQRDGYQWFKVIFKGLEGYMQYDSRVYQLEF